MPDMEEGKWVEEVLRREERDLRLLETSEERFDRIAFAQRALDLVRPTRTRVAIGEGRVRVHVESGRNWRGGAPGSKWGMLLVPRTASRRAIALGVLELIGEPTPFSLDVLLALATGAA
jgi:hypothetical protein